MLRDLRAEHADTINELEKTRNMLITQHKINKDYQMEVEDVTRKMEENQKEYETRQEELAQLLDIRAVRIRKLESQMRDVAYGTRQYRTRPEEVPEEQDSDIEDLEDTITLERGQNLFEIHVKKMTLSEEALRIMGDDEPSIFATWEFYEFEIQSTPVVRGPKPEYNFTSQYTVKVDDFFLHYLQKDSCTLELHQSFGTDYRTMAACQLNMREILDKSHGRLHGKVMLTGVSGEGQGINFGVVEYWVRLKVPMEQALRLYKERSKALGYIQSNIRTAEQALEAMDETATKRPPDNVNRLDIKITQCAGLKGRREGIQPSPYCVYKFFDFNDHDTTIVEGSNNPQYNDHKSFPVPMTADLDKYLKAQPLKLYVFDDTDPEETKYLGLAKIPLIPLAHDKLVQGIFELFNNQGKNTGTVEVALRWQFSYLPPKSSTMTLAQLRAIPDEPKESVHLLPGEEESLSQIPIAGTASNVAYASRPPRHKGPAATSTPLKQDPDILQPVPRVRYQDTVHEDPTMDGEELASGENSVVTEGSPVPGESEPISSASESSSSRRVPPIDRRPSPLDVEAAARKAQARRDEEEEAESITPTPEDVSTEEERTPQQLIAEELGAQLEDESELQDTMFDDQKISPTGDDFDDESDLDTEEEGEEEPGQRSDRSHGSYETVDSEVVIASPGSRPHSSLSNMNPAESVLVAISELSLDEGSHLLNNTRVKMLYVEYTFLAVPREETETPYSLPTPVVPNKAISFNFTKVFHVDYDNNYERRQFLASMLLPDDPDGGKIRFTVVAEPEDPDDDCEDVGSAYADLQRVLDTGKDIEDEDLPIVDIHDESVRVGSLRCTVRCLKALRAVKQEMEATDTSMEA